MKNIIVWTIAGLDPSGGAGISTDVKTFANFNVHSCVVLSCLVPQNNEKVTGFYSPPRNTFIEQIDILKNTFPPAAIKIGLIKKQTIIYELSKQLSDIDVPIIHDPVFATSSGYPVVNQVELASFEKYLFPKVNLLTPNILEVEKILKCKILSEKHVEMAAIQLLGTGIKQVIIKGGHFSAVPAEKSSNPTSLGISSESSDEKEFSNSSRSQILQGNETSARTAADFWTNGAEAYWLYYPFISQLNVRGTGCAFSSALTANLARGDHVLDAFIKAKAYVFQGILHAVAIDENHAVFAHHPPLIGSLPSIKSSKIKIPIHSFQKCSEIGFYPIVDNIELLEKLITLGVRTIQLRIKNRCLLDIEKIIAKASVLAIESDINLFINDYWQLAIKYKAYGVHLGQDDINTADLDLIAKAGLRLGISCHSYAELALAAAIAPSYVAVGPVFSSSSKPNLIPLPYEQLCCFRQLTKLPMVAIGGISLENVKKILAAGVEGIAVISALTVGNLAQSVGKWLKIINIYEGVRNAS